jgi:dTDP-glucose 4,6-dehydratase
MTGYWLQERNMDKAKLLITGGAGFIGSNFVHYTLKEHPDYELVVLDKLTYAGRLENLQDIIREITFIKGDICKRKDVEKAIQGCDIIINFAAETHVDRSIIDAGEFVKTDVLGTYTLLETSRRYKIDRFVHISTDEVYGSIAKGSFNEEDPLKPNSPYSASKAGADMLVRSYYKTYNLPVVITRSSNNYGPYQFPEKVIPLFITNIIREKKVPLYGDGLNVRDWLYVMDNCKAIDKVFQKGVIGEIYNVGGGYEITNIDLTRKILGFMGKGEEYIEYVKDRPGHDHRYSLNCEKVRKLGRGPEMEFDKRLEETIEWYKINDWWWKSLV